MASVLSQIRACGVRIAFAVFIGIQLSAIALGQQSIRLPGYLAQSEHSIYLALGVQENSSRADTISYFLLSQILSSKLQSIVDLNDGDQCQMKLSPTSFPAIRASFPMDISDSNQTKILKCAANLIKALKNFNMNQKSFDEEKLFLYDLYKIDNTFKRGNHREEAAFVIRKLLQIAYADKTLLHYVSSISATDFIEFTYLSFSILLKKLQQIASVEIESSNLQLIKKEYFPGKLVKPIQLHSRNIKLSEIEVLQLPPIEYSIIPLALYLVTEDGKQRTGIAAHLESHFCDITSSKYLKTVLVKPVLKKLKCTGGGSIDGALWELIYQETNENTSAVEAANLIANLVAQYTTVYGGKPIQYGLYHISTPKYP